MNKDTLGGMIAAFRKEQGWTQAQLAEKMNVTDKAVSKWERDLSCPDISTIPKLADLLGVTADELLRAGQPPQKTKGTVPIIRVVLKGLALAMGITVTVLSAMGKMDHDSAIGMLGLGLAAAGLSLLQEP